MIAKQTAPPLRLQDHCKVCEFQEICYVAAKEKDDLSLLKGLSRKYTTSRAYHKKRLILDVTAKNEVRRYFQRI